MRLMIGLVKDRLLGCMGQVYSGVFGKERSQGNEEVDGVWEGGEEGCEWRDLIFIFW